MMLRRYTPALILLSFPAAFAAAQTPSSPPSLAVFDETTLRRAGIEPDAANLLAVVRRRTHTDGDPPKINALIVRLGHPQFAEREQATADLIALGRPAQEALRQAQTHPDPEVRQRAEQCLRADEKLWEPAVSLSVVRRLLYLRTEGAAELLLQLLPEADWEIQDEIVHGLQRVALREGKLDPALLAALEDKSPLRRAAAALTVALAGNSDERQRVRGLLDDREPEVRLRAAQGLLAVHDACSLPVLIALLNEADVEISWSAEELLHWVAGEKAPTATVGTATAAERQKAVTAWTAWHKAAASKIDWQQVEAAPRRPGLYLACGVGQIWVGGCDGKRCILVKYRYLSGINFATDARLLPGNQLLATFDARDFFSLTLEGSPAAFPCHTFKGQMCQRLPNGIWFVAERKRAAEKIDQEGSERAAVDFEEGVSLGDAWLTRSGQLIGRSREAVMELDRFSGKALQQPLVDFEDYEKFAVRPDGCCVLADRSRNRLVEMDITGRTRRTFSLLAPYSVEALRNDHYLVTTTPYDRILEMDQEGRVVWETFTDTPIYRVRSILERVRIGFDKPRPADFNLDSPAHRIRDLRNADPQVRRRAADFLNFLRPIDEASLDALAAALNDENDDVRHGVTATLGRIGQPAVPSLLRTLAQGTPRSRAAAVTALKEMGTAANAAVPAVLAVAVSAEENAALREQALETLGAIGAETPTVVAPLLHILMDDDQPEALRNAAGRGVGRLAAAMNERPIAFDEQLRNPQLPQAQSVALLKGLSLGRNGQAALHRLLKEGDRTLRCRAIQLCDNSEMGVTALPALKEARKDPDLWIRGLATVVVHNIAMRDHVPFLEPNQNHW